MAGAPVLTEGILLLFSFQQRNTGLRQPTSPFQQHPSLARYALGRGRTLERSRLGPPEQAQGPRSQRRIPPHPSSPPHAVGVPPACLPASLGPSSLLSGVCRDQGPLLSALPPTWAHLAWRAGARLSDPLAGICLWPCPTPPTPSCQRPRGTWMAQGLSRHTVFPFPRKLPASSGPFQAPFFSLSVSPCALLTPNLGTKGPCGVALLF